MTKSTLKQKAIDLRKQGKTYSEIMAEVPVVKSTISLWLREVGLSAPQKQRITQKRKDAQMRGAQVRYIDRIRRQHRVMKMAKDEIETISNRELWLMGAALYWAEGSKQKEHNPGAGVQFSNSDPRMVRLFLKWLDECAGVPIKDVSADLYIHDSHKEKIEEVLRKWSKVLSVPRSFFKHVYLKRNKIRTKRKNTGILYIGLLRVNISASSDLNRRIAGWINGICEHCGVV